MFHEEFVSYLPSFQNILSEYLESHTMALLQNQVHSTDTTSYLKLTLRSNPYTVSIVISYDMFYQVPIMYFQVFTTGEMDELVQQFDIEGLDIVREYVELAVDNHPFVPGTFFLVHPCETKSTVGEFMKQEKQEKGEQEQEKQQEKRQERSERGERGTKENISYLITWNTLYGTGIFNDLNLRYLSK